MTADLAPVADLVPADEPPDLAVLDASSLAGGYSGAFALVALLRARPPEDAPRSARVDWLLAMAAALDTAGANDQAQATRATAFGLVQKTIDRVAEQ